jgi:thiamine kinase-like enzyme
MIEGLNTLLAGSGLPGLSELRGLLEELLGGSGSAGRLLEQQTLQPRQTRVFRLRFSVNGQERSLIIKRLRPEIARRNELVAQRWLPAVHLDDAGPPVRASVAATNGACVWHVYDDLGQWELDPCEPDREAVRVATDLIARMHTRFAGHALLGEIRLYGGDLGIHFYEANVRDAIHALEALNPPAARSPLRESLLKRLHQMLDELPQRAQALAQWGGPETLLHGDLWAINVFVIPDAAAGVPPAGRSDGRAAAPEHSNGSPDGKVPSSTAGRTPPAAWRARLIDWDHAAVGPATYDLSTFLLRFPSEDRPWVLELYRQAVAEAGWRLPDERELNLLFETHEYARFANRIIWPAIALVQDRGEWGYDALAEIDEWFEQFGPVLPVGAEVAA